MEIPVPPMDIQKKIADECGAIDKEFKEEVDNLFRLRQNLSDYINSLQNGSTVKLSSVCSVKGGKRIPKGLGYVDTPTSHPYIRVSDFSDGTIDESNLVYITDDVFDKIKSYTISSDDVYISIAGSIGVVGTIPMTLNGANLTENAAKLIIDPTKTTKEYLSSILKSESVQEQIANATNRVGVPKLALHRIENILVRIPSMEEQNAAVAHILKIKKNIDAAKNVVESCASRKQAILDKYLK